MAKYLTKVVETYRVDTDEEVTRMIEEAKQSNKYELAKYTSEFKEVKQKGEVVDSFYLLSEVKVFNDPKDPYSDIEIHYHNPGTVCPCQDESEVKF